MALKKPEAGERTKPDSYDELFPGRFLKAGLFKGKEVTLRIVEVYQELMPDKKGTVINSDGERCKKQTIFKVETPAGRRLEQEIAINKTNAIAVLLMFGDKLRGPGGWEGRLITFASRTVEAFGETKEAIRVVGSPELDSDVERTRRVGQSDKTFQLKKTPMPPKVVQKPKVAPPPVKEPEPAEEPEADPFGGERAPAEELEQHELPDELDPLPDGRKL